MKKIYDVMKSLICYTYIWIYSSLVQSHDVINFFHNVMTISTLVENWAKFSVTHTSFGHAFITHDISSWLVVIFTDQLHVLKNINFHLKSHKVTNSKLSVLRGSKKYLENTSSGTGFKRSTKGTIEFSPAGINTLLAANPYLSYT